MNYILIGITSFTLTLLLTLIALRLFPKLNLMDRPHKYGLKRKPIPYYGGLIIILSFFISVLFFVPIDQRIIAILIGGLLIGIISFLDDLFSLSPFIRLFFQVFAGVILVFGGIGIKSLNNPFGAPIILDQFQSSLTVGGISLNISLLAAFFTIIWVVALMNTMNFLDGLNGLASGVSFIASIILFILSIRPHFHVVDQTVFATLALVLAGICLAFWLFDFYPAKILMGDTGSMFLGFILATLAIFSGGKIATAFLVMGFPILDAIWAIVRRILAGQSPFKGDLKHLHHRLLEAGLSNRKALFFIYSFCLLFGLIAVFLESSQKFWAIVVLFLVMFAVTFWLVRIAPSLEKE